MGMGPGRGFPPHHGHFHGRDEHEEFEETSSETVWLNKTNAVFGTRAGFLTLDSGDKHYDRVFLHRAFPFDMEWEYISVQNDRKGEIGMIRIITDFSDEQQELIRHELLCKYYSPEIKKIISVKEKFGFSYWKVQTDDGETSFTLQDTFKSIVHAGENSAILFDVDANRFTIPDISALDAASYKKIELYL